MPECADCGSFVSHRYAEVMGEARCSDCHEFAPYAHAPDHIMRSYRVTPP